MNPQNVNHERNAEIEQKKGKQPKQTVSSSHVAEARSKLVQEEAEA
jgi:hypothetical protein